MPTSASSTRSYTGLRDVHVTFIETSYDQDDDDHTNRIEVKGYPRERRRPKSLHPFIIYNLNHLL